MSIILKAENISKQYRLGTVGTGTLRDDLKRWWFKVRGKEDPFLKVGAKMTETLMLPKIMFGRCAILILR